MELAPERIDVVLGVGHASELHEMVANSRVGSIAAEHKIKGDFNLFGTISVGGCRSLFEPGFVGIKVGTSKLVVEEELHVWKSLELVK